MSKRDLSQPLKAVTSFFGDEPDVNWKIEVSKLFPWLDGRGADIGCGGRTLDPSIIRVDIDEKVKPDKICPGDKLPFKDNELDFIISIHSFEHFEDQKKTLKEWLRVIHPGGIIGIIHPDVNYTKSYHDRKELETHNEEPYNHHYHETDLAGFIKMLEPIRVLGFDIVDYGMALEKWSFYAILQKMR